jgi:hypothetical protein
MILIHKINNITYIVEDKGKIILLQGVTFVLIWRSNISTQILVDGWSMFKSREC